jgi:UDP-N-acetyl-D-glucosamine dehydrogenase
MTSLLDSFLKKIADRSADVGVIGQGYVGLPLSLVFVEAGLRVLGLDIDGKKIAALSKGESYIKHIGSGRVAAAAKTGRFPAPSDFDRLAECDAILICVPTPLGKHREPDNGYIHATAREIVKRLRKGQLVVLESTTYPGTTDEEVQGILAASGLKCPEDYFLAFSPEREDPGNKSFNTKTIPKVVGGINPESTKAAVALYSLGLDRVVPVSSARVAESCKLLENVFRSVNIALVNELKVAFEKMGIDIWEVIEAAKTKPFGFTPFYPGPGLGGHCIPLDPFYLSWKAAEYGVWTRFIELAGEINTSMPHYVVSRVAQALNEDKKAVKGAKILVLGLAYKADIDDDRESPSYEIIEMLQEAGAQVAYCDPFFPVTMKTRKHDLQMQSVPCSPEGFAGYDALVIATAHQQFKRPELFDKVSLAVDCRNLIVGLSNAPTCRVVKA